MARNWLTRWADREQKESDWAKDAERHMLALAQLPANVFIADKDLNLVYLNASARRAIREIAPMIREQFGVDVESLLGGSIHRFHRDPRRIESILRNPERLPHEAKLAFGDVVLQTTIDAVKSTAGEVIGYVVSWTNISEQTRFERRVDEGVGGMLSDIEAIANGDLTRAITTVGDEKLGRVGAKVAEMVTRLASDIGQISASSTTLAAATEEMRASAEEISRNTTQAEQVAATALASAKATGDVISRLEKASAEIGKVTRLINSIAEQTNLLALNATIEAARAGDAGKGFAVVASEVKDLAKETADATNTITTRIQEIQNETANAVRAVSEIVESTESVHERQAAIAGALVEQTSTTGELAQIAAAMREVAARFRTK